MGVAHAWPHLNSTPAPNLQVVLTSDDNALSYFGVPYLKAHPTTNASFVITGVNGEPMKSYPDVFTGDAPGNRTMPICGCLERTPLEAVLSLAHSLKPTFRRIVLLADQSACTGSGVGRVRWSGVCYCKLMESCPGPTPCFLLRCSSRFAQARLATCSLLGS